ncbi:MarR family winged helix-turn-helix transcriptional regulator [Bacteroidota bacterium]
MGIEEAIKQKKFKNEHHRLVINIFFTSSFLHAKHTKILKPHGLSSEQYNVLRILRGKHPEQSTVSNIQDRMLDKSSNASRLIDKLFKKDLVTREECKSDRRQMDVKITDKGLELLELLDAQVDGIHRDLEEIPEKEASMVNDILNRVHGS